MAKRRDWIFRGLLACCALALSASLLFFIQYLLQSVGLLRGLRIAQFADLSWLQDWDAVVLALTFLLFAFLLYYAARRRAVSNSKMRPSAGCPSCHESKLVRVARYSRDRFMAYSFIPMGRFVCPNCAWEGRRIILRSSSSRFSKSPTMPSQILTSNDSADVKRDQESSIKPGLIAPGSKEEQGQDVTRPGDAGLEKQEKPTPPSSMDGSDLAELFLTGKGYQLKDKWSNHVITVQAQDSRNAAELGEVVGTLHVQLWQSTDSETGLQAWLDHSTTTVTIYEKIREEKRAQN